MFKYLLIIPTLIFSNLVHAQNSLSFQYAQPKWNKSTYKLGAETLKFKRDNISAYIIQFDYLFKNNFSLGIATSYQAWDVLTDTQGPKLGFASLTNRSIVGKYFFLQGNLQPYIGASVGQSELRIQSQTRAYLEGQSQYAFIGVTYKFSNRIEFNLNYQKGNVSLNDTNGIEFKDSSEELRLGINVLLGRR